jgi:hypothetical protein
VINFGGAAPLTALGYTADVVAGIIKTISDDNSDEAEQVIALFANELRQRAITSVIVTDTVSMSNEGDESEETNLNSNLSCQNENQFEQSSINDGSGESNQIDFANSNGVESEERPQTIVETIQSNFEEFSSIDNYLSNSDSNNVLDSKTLSVTIKIEESNDRDASFSVQNVSSSDQSPGSELNTATAAKLPSLPYTTPKFLGFKEGMPEHTVQSAVRNLIFDEYSPEGNTRKLFIESFSSASNNSSNKLLDFRHFIDGMHEYFIQNRGATMSLLFEQERQHFIINYPKYSEMDNVKFLKMLSMKSKSKESEYRIQPKRASLKFLKESIPLSQIDESVLSFVSFVVFMVLEESMFLPLQDEIIKLLPSYGNEVIVFLFVFIIPLNYILHITVRRKITGRKNENI